jgi:hypothetical protein
LLYKLKGSGGSFQQFPTTGTTNAKGVVTFTTFKPTTPVDVELRFAGNVSYLKATSSAADVAEGFRITLKASAQKLKPKHTVTFSGVVDPAGAERQVELQVLKGKSWVRVTTAKLTDESRYTFKLKLTKAGSFSYRILADALSPYAASTSDAVHVLINTVDHHPDGLVITLEHHDLAVTTDLRFNAHADAQVVNRHDPTTQVDHATD